MAGARIIARGNSALVDALGAIASAAGAVVLRHRGCAVDAKSDGSPVTIADQEAEALVLAGLEQVLPGVPVVSEEAASAGVLPATPGDFLLVDALDGTKEFIAGSAEFTINIALIQASLPVAAALYAPALGRLWLAGQGAEVCDLAPGAAMAEARGRRAIHVRRAPADGLIALKSLRHGSAATEGYLTRFAIAGRHAAGSSLKFCVIAEGKADLYPRFSPTMEWDTAAGHAVLLAAGGAVVRTDLEPLTYGNHAGGFHNPDFIAFGDPALLPKLK